ncbi:MAG: nitroreductase family protein [Chlorobiales bacterium]|nr:nitroreductase family protein [Chlorobiales bacterium]
MANPDFLPLTEYREYSAEEMMRRATEFYEDMKRRRSVRNFSKKPVPKEVIETCLKAAISAPSAANIQPWKFVVISDPDVKRQIRHAAEREAKELYNKWAPEEGVDAFSPFDTSGTSHFLEDAPYLIAVFANNYGFSEMAEEFRYYYVRESVGIATGILITAIHRAGLAMLTHTPNPMNFLNRILKRPDNEQPVLILVVGYPAENAIVPNFQKKSLDEAVTFI